MINKKCAFKNLGNKEISLLIVFAFVPMSIFGSTVVTSEDGSTEITSLPFTADVPGHTYYLTRDLTCSDGGAAGITIAADNITIDGKGYKITGTATPSDCEWFGETEPCTASGIYNPSYDNVVIRNIKITGFGTGIALKGTAGNKIQNNIVDNCEIYDNGFNITSGGSEMVTHGIHACWLAQGNPGNPALKIINCDIYDNKGTGSGCSDGGNGIFIYAGGPESKDEYVVISNNRLHGNDKAGFWAKMMLSKSQLSNNIVYENGNGEGVTDPVRGGIVLRCKMSNYNTIEENSVYDNNGDGLFIGGNHNDIRDNDIIANSHHGVNFARNDGSKNNYLYRNVICSNHEYDVYNVHTEADNTGDENTGTTAYHYRDEGTTGDTYFTYPCSGNNPPNQPSKPDGPTSGKVGTSYSYSTSTTDPDGDNIRYGWDWDGDEIVDEWTSFYESGETITTLHTWTKKGTYNVRVKAQDEDGLESEWSDPLPVTMPKNKELATSLLLRFLEQHPRMFPMLRQLLGI